MLLILNSFLFYYSSKFFYTSRETSLCIYCPYGILLTVGKNCKFPKVDIVLSPSKLIFKMFYDS